MSDKSMQKIESGTFSLYVVKKSEKIVSAIYLVTSLFHEDEPLRTKLRQSALSLLSDINSIGHFHSESTSSINVGRSVSDILSYLSVAHNAHLLGEMNYSILEKELISLVDVTGGSLSNTSPIQFKKGFFGTEPKMITQHASAVETEPQEGDGMAFSVGERQDSAHSKLNTGMPVKRESVRRKKSIRVQKAKETRRDQILQILKDKKEVSIKDISNVVRGYSEKTIQRELSSLIRVGIVKKSGTRRWSTYSLKDR